MHLFFELSRRQQGSPPNSSPPDGGNGNSTTTSTQGSAPTPTSGPQITPSSTSTPHSDSGSKPTYIVVCADVPTSFLSSFRFPMVRDRLTKSPQAIVASIVVILALLFAFYLLRQTRMKHKNPKYIPTSFLKKAWLKWEPEHYRLPDRNEHLEPISSTRTGLRPPSSVDATAPGATQAAGVDRNTSVRSVMTLPAYHPNALHNEQVLGREGERGGIDVVIEFPETVDEEERQREEEMEALYQVRLARRRENEEREERRRLRREARARGDYVALREIQERARASSAATAGQTVEELRADHARIKQERQRAVSSVSYGDLGVARHDGTRVRANSTESERVGLLGDAASIAASSRHHRRDHSTSSILSIDTMNSDLPSPGLTRSRANSRPESPLRRFSTASQHEGAGSQEGRAGSSPEIIDHEDVPPHSPPEYENISLETPHEEPHHQEPPPGYSSPILARGEGKPTVEPTHNKRLSATHVGQLISDRRTSSSGSGGQSASRTPGEGRRTSRGVGGIPQLPSLRLGSLPSIHVDSPSPTVRRIDESEEHHSEE
jgi:hypothetical protein